MDKAQVMEELRAREPLAHREPHDADRAHFEAMLTPGMVHIGASGHRAERQDYLDFTLRRYVSGDHGDDHEWVVEQFDVVEHAPGLWAAVYVLHQGTRVSRRFTLWEWSGERWQARYHQGTPIGG